MDTLKIMDCVNQVNQIVNEYNTISKYREIMTDIIARYNTPYSKEVEISKNINKINELFQIVFEAYRDKNIPYEIKIYIKNQYKDNTESIKKHLNDIISFYGYIQPKLVFDDITIIGAHKDYMVRMINYDDTMRLVKEYLEANLNQPESVLEELWITFQKIRNYFHEYANKMELPIKCDWEVNK